jgi:hypothetical protein
MGTSLDLSPANDEVCGPQHEYAVDRINHLDVFHPLSSLLSPFHFPSSLLFRDLTSSTTSIFPVQHLASFCIKSTNFNSGVICDIGDGDVRLLPARHLQRSSKKAVPLTPETADLARPRLMILFFSIRLPAFPNAGEFSKCWPCYVIPVSFKPTYARSLGAAFGRSLTPIIGLPLGAGRPDHSWRSLAFRQGSGRPLIFM